MHKTEFSYGIIPLCRWQGGWKTLLVKHGKGHWAFPKGHAEEGEEPKQTAVRELQEETGLEVVSFLNLPPQQERYFFHEGSHSIDKTVIYFAAEVSGDVTIQQAEISEFRWLSLEEAQQLATFPETKKLCAGLIELLI